MLLKNIYIQSINAGVIFCELDLIRNVKKINFEKWFSVKKYSKEGV